MDGTPQPCSRNTKVLRQTISQGNPPLTAQLSSRSSDGKVELSLVLQPEEQHRARYQTEGSRGAVKDRSGLGHPTVKVEYSLHCCFAYIIFKCFASLVLSSIHTVCVNSIPGFLSNVMINRIHYSFLF